MSPSTPSEAPPASTSTTTTSGAGGWRSGTILSAIAIVLSILALALNLVVPGPAGPGGTPYTVQSQLPPGQNETGLYSAAGGPLGAYMISAPDFRIPLAADLPSNNVSFVPNSSSYTANCPGPGEALPGQLCVYQTLNQSSLYGGIVNEYSAHSGASRYGFEVYFYAGSNTYSFSYGTWTVAAS